MTSAQTTNALGSDLMSTTTGFAKADTPFGALAGRTRIEITHNGLDLAIITFRCGDTPVTLTVAGEHLNALITGLIEQQNDVAAKRNERLLHLMP